MWLRIWFRILYEMLSTQFGIDCFLGEVWTISYLNGFVDVHLWQT